MRFLTALVLTSTAILVRCTPGAVTAPPQSRGGPTSVGTDPVRPSDAAGDAALPADGDDSPPPSDPTPPGGACTCVETDGTEDAAVIVEAVFPDTLAVDHTDVAWVTVANVGTSTWTATGNYMLGAVDDDDPFNADGRVPIEPSVRVCGSPTCPGRYRFAVPMRGPRPPGEYVTDWQMLVELRHWFGDTVTRTVTVDVGTCGEPIPPPLAHFNIKPHNAVWDSTAIVYGRWYNGTEANYCELIGYTDQRIWCPPRPEGHPEVFACEAYVVGIASDTGLVGPTWAMEDAPCGTPGDTGCENTANQFQVRAYGPGTLRACGNVNGVCSEIEVP